MAKTRNGVKNSKSRHQPYSKRTQSQTAESSQHDETQDPASKTEPDPEYIPRTSRKTTSRNFSLNVDNDDSEPVSKNLRSRTHTNSLENRRASLENEQNFDNEQNLENEHNLAFPTSSNYQNSVRHSSSENQALISSILDPESVPNPNQSNSNPTQNPSVPDSVPISVSNLENANSSSSRRRSTRKRKRSSAENNNAQNGQNGRQRTVPNVQNIAVSNTESQSSSLTQNSSQITENSNSSSFWNPEIGGENINALYEESSTPLNEVATTSHSMSVQVSNEGTQTQMPSNINSFSAEPNADSNDSGENSVENGTLSPYQRVTRNLYRTGAVNDPDIELDVFEEYARIRMGTMNMTVSMKENQTVVFRFDSNPGLNFWSNSDTYPPIQPVNPQSFPDLLPLPRLVEHKIKDLASSCENGRTFGINDLNRIFNELQDISDSHPVALIMISILEALDKIPPSGQLEDIAFMIPDIQRAFEKLDLPSLKHGGADGEDDSGSIVDFDGYGKPISDERDLEENGDEGGEGDNCSICLSGLVTQFPLAQLKVCKHVFHADCLKSWHTVKYTCPLCRSHLSPLKVKLEYRMHSI